MDPLLKSLTDSTFKQLVQETRPAWAIPASQGRPDAGPPAEARTPSTRNIQDIQRDIAALEREEPKTYAQQAWRFLRRMGLEGRKALHEELAGAERGKPNEWNLGDAGTALDMFPYALGIMVGAKGAQNLGGKNLYKYLLGKQALEKGEDPLEVWKRYQVGRTKEGSYGMELPLEQSVEGALEQFRRAYGNSALRSVILKELKPGQAREGFYTPSQRQVYAAGDPNLPITDPNSTRAVLEHELSHAADHQEGWSPGARPMNADRPTEDPAYWNNASEVRARAAERRLDPAARELPAQFDEDVARELQIVSKYPAAVAAAVKEPGGMWHPEAVERLSNPLRQRLFEARSQVPVSEFGRVDTHNQTMKTWSDRAIRNYLNKYAGTERDPLKDVEIPRQGMAGADQNPAVKWGEVVDQAIAVKPGRMYEDSTLKARPEEPVFNVWSGNRFEGSAGDASNNLQSYLSHVGDYLRQNVPADKLPQYDLVRAVRETAANDARVAKEMEKAAAASMKDLPVYKDYGDGFKWVELKKPERLTEGQVKGVRQATQAEMRAEGSIDPFDMPGERGEYVEGDIGYVAVGADGKPIRNSYTGSLAMAGTPEEAHLAGQLAQEGNQMGHCVGWYCEGVAAGASRIFSLRDGKGRSHVTVDVDPRPHNQEGHPGILQIKGKQNRAPNPEYLPYVQDFVRSGKWGEVGDLENTGLVTSDTILHNRRFSTSEQDQLHKRLERGKYYTEQEVMRLLGPGDI